jgi:hypothetical protein
MQLGMWLLMLITPSNVYFFASTNANQAQIMATDSILTYY